MRFLMAVFFLIIQFFPHTYEDAVILATVIYKENYSTGETEQDRKDCQILTGVVPVNRAMNGGWGGNTIKSVIFAKGQYAESTKAAIGKVTPPKELIKLADDIMTYGTNVPNYIGRWRYSFWLFSDYLRSSGYTERLVTVIRDIRRNSDCFISRWLDKTDKSGGTDQ